MQFPALYDNWGFLWEWSSSASRFVSYLHDKGNDVVVEPNQVESVDV